MTFSYARFGKLSIPLQSLIIAAFTTPLFAVFAVVGDVPRGALAWTFSGALMIAFQSQRDNASFRQLLPPAVILLMVHVPLVVWNPLGHAASFGGIIRPIALVDYCIDYAFLWLWLRVFKTTQRDAGEANSQRE